MKLFNQTAFTKPRKSGFDLSHERKMSGQMGELIPILCEEVVPGDTWKVNTEVMLRLMPMLAPIMHRVDIYTHYFFVPNRLVWTDWEKFITGGETGQEMPVMPYVGVTAANVAAYPLLDYMGVQITGSTRPVQISALPFRAYLEVYNEYYRDQNLTSKVVVSKGSGVQTAGDITNLLTMRKRAWEKDYFTSALPWTQRGGHVVLPATGDMPVYLKTGIDDKMVVKNNQGDVYRNSSALGTDSSGQLVDTYTGGTAYIDPKGQLYADASEGSGTSIEELRRATKLQTWLEKNARGGSRYIEQMLAHFGVRSSDARLQRPEYLGGGKTPVVISEVLQTSETNQTISAQGNMAGHGVGVGNTHAFKKYFEEHGWIIGIVSVLPKTTYQNGVRRHFLKTDKFDYYFPEFAQLGEQPIDMDELYAGSGTVDRTFGYQSRYAEYKYIPSSAHGKLRGDMSFWHMGRIFSTEPALNSAFVESDPTSRIFAVTDTAKHKLVFQIYNNVKAIRPMPFYNIPSI